MPQARRLADLSKSKSFSVGQAQWGIKTDDLVVFKKGLYEDEEGAIYQAVEINGDRALLEPENTNMVIQPQSVAMLADLDIFDEKPLVWAKWPGRSAPASRR